jgi:hypothetical protein
MDRSNGEMDGDSEDWDGSISNQQRSKVTRRRRRRRSPETGSGTTSIIIRPRERKAKDENGLVPSRGPVQGWIGSRGGRGWEKRKRKREKCDTVSKESRRLKCRPVHLYCRRGFDAEVRRPSRATIPRLGSFTCSAPDALGLFTAGFARDHRLHSLFSQRLSEIFTERAEEAVGRLISRPISWHRRSSVAPPTRAPHALVGWGHRDPRDGGRLAVWAWLTNPRSSQWPINLTPANRRAHVPRWSATVTLDGGLGRPRESPSFPAEAASPRPILTSAMQPT